MNRKPGPSAGEARRALSSLIDGAITAISGLVFAGFFAASGIESLGKWWFWVGLLGAILAVSFLNHVVLTGLGGASIGKSITGIRIVREDNGLRPGWLHMTKRWLWGFYWTLVIVPLSAAASTDVNQEDMEGLKVVRRGSSA